eukprot:s1716_g6.t1
MLARNPWAILARPQWELARGQFFKMSLRELARRCLRFGAFSLARCRREADFGLGFLGSSDSRLFCLFHGISASRLVWWLLSFLGSFYLCIAMSDLVYE